jgi:hypothetical protein
MKQIGLAFHNFHDSRNGIVPSCVRDGSFNLTSQFGLLYPYLEQQALWDRMMQQYTMTSGYVCGNAPIVSNDWWRKLSTQEKQGFASVSVMKCPTRRAGVQMNDTTRLNESGNGLNPDGAGPLGDYAAVCVTTTQSILSATGDAERTWFAVEKPAALNIHCGPFRLAINSFSGAGTTTSPGQYPWSPRDTFARITDGLSNQLFFGEKHIPLNRLGKCPNVDYNSSVAEQTRNSGDCSYLQTGWRKSSFNSRAMVFYVSYALTGNPVGDEVTNPILRPTDFSDNVTPAHNAAHQASFTMAFGSYHPGVCQFVLGDGSVQSLSTTTALATLKAYAHVSDGVGVSLP